MRLAIYSRSDSGIISFHGVESWDSVADYLAAAGAWSDELPEGREMWGWPDAKVCWYGNLGIAIRPRSQKGSQT